MTDEERKAYYGLVDGPVWQDGCRHDKGSYVASFEVWERKTLQTFDLYVFDERGESSVCLRYGNEGGEYISPGDVGQFCRTSFQVSATEYRRAYEILQHLGTFHWKPKA